MTLALSCGEEGLTSNELAQLEDGEVCFADNYDRLASGWTDEMLHQWCDTGKSPEHWHDRMIRDKCATCPECCAKIVRSTDEQEDN